MMIVKFLRTGTGGDDSRSIRIITLIVGLAAIGVGGIFFFQLVFGLDLVQQPTIDLVAAVVMTLLGASLVGYILRYTTDKELTPGLLQLAARVFEQSSEAILVTDKNENVISINQAFT